MCRISVWLFIVAISSFRMIGANSVNSVADSDGKAVEVTLEMAAKQLDHGSQPLTQSATAAPLTQHSRAFRRMVAVSFSLGTAVFAFMVIACYWALTRGRADHGRTRRLANDDDEMPGPSGACGTGKEKRRREEEEEEEMMELEKQLLENQLRLEQEQRKQQLRLEQKIIQQRLREKERDLQKLRDSISQQREKIRWHRAREREREIARTRKREELREELRRAEEGGEEEEEEENLEKLERRVERLRKRLNLKEKLNELDKEKINELEKIQLDLSFLKDDEKQEKQLLQELRQLEMRADLVQRKLQLEMR